MAKASWIGLDSFIAKVENLPRDLLEGAEEIVTDCAKEGADIMYQNIDRIDTEFMKGSVGNSDASRKGDTVSADFGWGIEGAEVEDYFIYQEKGFTHTSGKKIPPMHALLGAFIETRERFYRRISELARK